MNRRSGLDLRQPAYNALGQRVRDVTQTNTTDEAYGAGGGLLWRYTGGDSNTRAFVPFGGRILADYYSNSTILYHPDQLGSISTASDYTGNDFQERLFYPYGELWTGAGWRRASAALRLSASQVNRSMLKTDESFR